MTLIKTLSHPKSKRERKRVIATYLGVTLMGALLSMALFVRSDWDKKVVIACVAYTLIATLFLGIQMWGFVVSQSFYSEEVEEAKFALLKLEEAEWGE